MIINVLLLPSSSNSRQYQQNYTFPFLNHHHHHHPSYFRRPLVEPIETSLWTPSYLSRIPQRLLTDLLVTFAGTPVTLLASLAISLRSSNTSVRTHTDLSESLFPTPLPQLTFHGITSYFNYNSSYSGVSGPPRCLHKDFGNQEMNLFVKTNLSIICIPFIVYF